jgi:RNA polymerase sigma factor (sigma-70 family)
MATAPASTILHHLHHLPAPSGNASDGELLQRVACDRDEDAFTSLVRRHGPLVHGVCWRILQHRQDVEDVFQATFFVLARKAASVRWQRSIAAWLHEVAYRLARKTRSQAARRAAVERQAASEVRQESAPDDVWQELRDILDAELSKLSETYRTPLLLCYLEGQTQDQAAQQLSVSPRTLRRRLEVARRLLRDRLARRGLTLSLGLFTAALAPPSLTATLQAATVRGALTFAAGKMPLGPLSTRSVSLAEGGLHSMGTAKIKLVLAGVLTLLVLVATGLAGHNAFQREGKSEPREEQPAQASASIPPETPATEKGPRTDRYGDPLPPGAIARLGTLRFQHGEHVENIHYFPDGKRIVSQGRDLTRFWDARTGKELPLPKNLPRATFVPTVDKMLAVRRQRGGLLVLDASTGEEVRRLPLGDLLNKWALAANGKTLVASSFENQRGKLVPALRFCDIATGTVSEPVPLEKGETVNNLLLSADGKTLLLHDRNNLQLHVWDVATRSPRLSSRRGEKSFAGHVALFRDGKTVATASFGGKKIHLWDARTLKELPPLVGQWDKGVNSLTFLSDGKRLGVTYTSPIFWIWDLTTRKAVRKIQGHDFQVFKVAFSPDGKTVAAGDGSSVSLWDPATGKCLHQFHHTYTIWAIAFSPDGKTLVSGASYTDHTVRVWDTLTGKETAVWRGHTGGIEAVVFSPDGKWVATGSQDKTVRIWDFPTGKTIHQLEPKDGMVYGLAVSPDGRTIATGGVRQAIHLWDSATGRKLRSFANPGSWVLRLAFSPDGKWLASRHRDGNPVRLWDVASGKVVRTFGATDQKISSFSFSSDSRLLATGGYDGSVRLWDLATGRQETALTVPQKPEERPGNWVYHVAFSPDGRSLAAAYMDQSVCLWEVASGNVRTTFTGHRSAPLRVTYSSDGRLLASAGGDRTILVWDVRGQILGPRPGANLDAQTLNALWHDLAGDASGAYQAMKTLQRAGSQTVSLLNKHLKPVAPLKADRVQQLLADLDSDTFTVREKAEHELRQLGDLAEGPLRKVLAGKPSAEKRRRIEGLLEALDPAHAPERLRVLRAVEVLEAIANAEARQLLSRLASGAPGAGLTREAEGALKRLRGR